METEHDGNCGGGWKQRLEEIGRLGEVCIAKRIEIDDQRIVVAKLKSELDGEKKTFKALVAELDVLHKDIEEVATGGFAESLPLGVEKTKNDETLTAADEWRDNWRAVPTSELLRGMNQQHLAKVLAAGLETFGHLEDSLAAGEKIAGIGEAAMQFIDDARENYFAKNPVVL